MDIIVLGISAYYHDSAATLTINGEIIAAAQEERFTRKKHDSSFPVNAIVYVINESGLELKDLTYVVFYDKPFIKFERLLETYHAFAPKGLASFVTSMPVWLKEKLFIKNRIKSELKAIGKVKAPVLFPEHHLSHAASAFYPSPFKEAAILTIDGVGEWATTTIGYGVGNDIKIIKELHFPHSLGLLYSAFTYYCGFRVNSGEYKLMGLAPYGNSDAEETSMFKELIMKELIDIKDDGSLLMNMSYFRFATGFRMTDDKRWTKLFGISPRKPESEITQSYMNMALAIQQVTEEIVIKMAKTAKALTGSDNLVMAGGVALNSVANGKLLSAGIFKDIWIQPAAGDAGGALGAALLATYLQGSIKRNPDTKPDSMKGAFLGPEFSDKQIMNILSKYKASYDNISNDGDLFKAVSKHIASGKVVGWYQGRMEFGPRALGNRSILGDARNPDMQKKMNLKIKYREGFRPFAPTVLEENISDYFDFDRISPYMLHVIPVKEERLHPKPKDYSELSLYDRLYFMRSDLPAITHIDNSARIQSVNKDVNSRYWKLIDEFKNQTGYGIVVNTSFNVRGEPIVCTPEDAFKCFMATEMDFLVMNNFVLSKQEQTGVDSKIKEKRRFKFD